MGKSVAILGGDKRFSILAKLLAEDGYEVKTFGFVDGCDMYETTLEETVRAEYVVLPLPLSRKEGFLNGVKECSLEHLWSMLRPEQKIYAGSIKKNDAELARAYGLHPVDYYADEALAIRNAVPTAEGAIAAAMAATDFMLHGAPCLVLGYGRIGKILAQKLKALGAKVSVSARKTTDLAWVEAMGFEPLYSYALDGKLEKFRIIFNTVPHELLGEKEIEQLRSDCVLIELASGSGFDLAAVERRNISRYDALALPGKVAPQSAAQAIRATLYTLWEELK